MERSDPGTSHWQEWHRQYEVAGSSLGRRLAAVQRRVRDVLDQQPPGEIRVLSMCAGQGRDLLGVLPGHARRGDVRARLVELDPGLAAEATRAAAAAGLDKVEVVVGDASDSGAYDGIAPAALLLVCGVFGNLVDADIRHMVGQLRCLCAPGATVIWTRHRVAPDLTPAVRSWFADAGFDEVGFDAEPGYSFGVGTHRLRGPGLPFQRGLRLFTFVGDGHDARL